MKQANLNSAKRKCRDLGMDQANRVIVFCHDKKTGKCADGAEMAASWKHLKRRLKEFRKKHGSEILRLKTGCIGICRGGPIIGVLPDGVWYGHCTPEVIDQIVDQHLLNGQVVSDQQICVSPLASPSVCDDCKLA